MKTQRDWINIGILKRDRETERKRGGVSKKGRAPNKKGVKMTNLNERTDLDGQTHTNSCRWANAQMQTNRDADIHTGSFLFRCVRASS